MLGRVGDMNCLLMLRLLNRGIISGKEAECYDLGKLVVCLWDNAHVPHV